TYHARPKHGGGSTPRSVAAPATKTAVTRDWGGSAGSALRRCPDPPQLRPVLKSAPVQSACYPATWPNSPWATLVWLGGTDGRPTPRFRTFQVYPKDLSIRSVAG